LQPRNVRLRTLRFKRFGKMPKRAPHILLKSACIFEAFVVDQKSPSKGKLAFETISGVTINIFVVTFYYACLN
jgi:hypothetical protein